jgi:hypothetical protein
VSRSNWGSNLFGISLAKIRLDLIEEKGAKGQASVALEAGEAEPLNCENPATEEASEHVSDYVPAESGHLGPESRPARERYAESPPMSPTQLHPAPDKSYDEEDLDVNEEDLRY